MTEIAVLGVDLGKNSCSVVGLDAGGRAILRRRLHRDGVVRLAAGSPGCVVAVEVCCEGHHLGRRVRDAGREVRLMSPESPSGIMWFSDIVFGACGGRRPSAGRQARGGSGIPKPWLIVDSD